jgi:phenylacetate-CoA ligase
MGSPLKIYFTKEDHTIINLNWVRPLLANSVKFFDRRAVLARPHILPRKKWYQYIGLWRNVGISLFESTDSWIDRLRAYRPDVIHGYSMSLKLLAKTIKKRNIRDITPKVVFGTSELVDNECRKLVSDVFQTRLVDLYGAAETGCIAWECPICSNYHLNSDTVIVEFIRTEEKVSCDFQCRVVVTNLHSFAMPIIRYELDDIAIPIDKKALCGRCLPSMKVILGRSDDFVVLPSGKLLSPRFFSAIMREVVGVEQWRILQDDTGHIAILLVPSRYFSEITIKQLKDKVSRNAGEELQIEIRIVNQILVHQSGKMRSVVSTVSKSGL